MSWPNQNKTFQQRFRVFSAAFWQNNSNSFCLERSDKIVLPPSALNALTDCNAPFPVLLKIESIDKRTNHALASNVFSYVLDYSSPEGLIYMSSWMISKLNLEPSGQSVVELKLPTQNNLKYQCPIADFIQFQPHSLQLMLQDDITHLVHESLAEYYSSLRINDEITVYSNNNKRYKLSVIKISGKNTSYSPKCVRLNNNNNDIKQELMLGFSEPKNYDLDDVDNDNNDNNHNDDNNDDDRKKADDDIDESDGEWEIVSVEKVQSITDLKWKEPINNDKDDDIKIAPQPIIENNNDENDVLNAEDPPIKEEPIECKEWQCPKCKSNNEMAYKFCPKCGCSQNQWKPEDKKDKKDKNDKNDEKDKKDEKDALSDVVLKKVSVINDGTYSPNEERQSGWIVKNISNKHINTNARLIKFAGNNDVILKYNENIEFEMKPNDEMFILIEVKAPSIPKQYHMFYQLLNESGSRICEVLSLPVIVKSEYGDTKEKQIQQICDMGFVDRDKIITALKKWKWDELKAINWLATH